MTIATFWARALQINLQLHKSLANLIDIPEPQLSQWLVDALGIAGAITAISVLVFIFIIAPLLIAFRIEKNRRNHHR